MTFKQEKGKVLVRTQLSFDMCIVFHEKTSPILTTMFVNAAEKFKKEEQRAIVGSYEKNTV